MVENGFHKRYYRRLRDLIADLRELLRQRPRSRGAARHQAISAAFRERLMLAVTAVNGCRYCSYVHARLALASGMSAEEVEALRQGATDGCPPGELPALLYAQHWAESGSMPDERARQEMLRTYGERQLDAIESLLRKISLGNLLGNTLDYYLFRLKRLARASTGSGLK